MFEGLRERIRSFFQPEPIDPTKPVHHFNPISIYGEDWVEQPIHYPTYHEKMERIDRLIAESNAKLGVQTRKFKIPAPVHHHGDTRIENQGRRVDIFSSNFIRSKYKID